METEVVSGENQSKVACVLEQIRLEYEAAKRGLSGLARGKAQHNFIHATMDRMGELEQTLEELDVPPERAWMLIGDITNE